MISNAARVNHGRTSIVGQGGVGDVGDGDEWTGENDRYGGEGTRRIALEFTKREKGLRRKAVVRVDTGVSSDDNNAAVEDVSRGSEGASAGWGELTIESQMSRSCQ